MNIKKPVFTKEQAKAFEQVKSDYNIGVALSIHADSGDHWIHGLESLNGLSMDDFYVAIRWGYYEVEQTPEEEFVAHYEENRTLKDSHENRNGHAGSYLAGYLNGMKYSALTFNKVEILDSINKEAE
ncbi:hypothetical protein [Geomicrobium sp. JCM 19055]|uniref:hypothetical protein n=1 Tax=Geomicrobium sp. JCM 19055 TaxID=1460649 RepID=UPI00045EDA1D|nr:hypothetical protein [Geomicrobium sp. JCM 19055]GAK01489.1 hypothetical protein JCM19055_4655 [Geomicrobium sp. JCM 19055]